MPAQALIHSANARGSIRVGRAPSAALQQRSLLAVRPSRDLLRVKAEGEQPGAELENLDSDSARKKAAAERLRAAEKFMVVGTGEAECKGCGYTYTPSKGDPEYPVSPGTKFGDLPEDWGCPVCGAEKRLFESKQKELAGFAENQGYGLGTNSMTEGQKSALIYGSLGLFFLFFLLGYTLQ